jgi:hypothetical protein
MNPLERLQFLCPDDFADHPEWEGLEWRYGKNQTEADDETEMEEAD